MVPQRHIVLDTMSLIFAVCGRLNERRIYRMCRVGHYRLTTTAALVAELDRALRYPRFGFTARQVDEIVRDFVAHASLLEPKERIDEIRDDPEDNRVLECAVAGRAQMIVTADPHLLAIAVYRNILILPAASAINLLSEGVV